MKNFYDQNCALLPESMVKQAAAYFYCGNFHGLPRWEVHDANRLLRRLQEIYERLGGQDRWGKPFEKEWFIHHLSKNLALSCGLSSDSWHSLTYSLGRYYQFCPIIPVLDREKAVFWYQVSSQAGCLEARLALAYWNLSVSEIQKAWEEMGIWEKKCNQRNNAEMYPEGSALAWRNPEPYTIAKSLLDLNQRQAQGDLFATLQLAYCYLYGLCAPQDLSKPFEWCQAIVKNLGRKQAKGIMLTSLEEVAREAALELLGCYYLQGVGGIVKPSFWRAAALRIMSTTYCWKDFTGFQGKAEFDLTPLEVRQLEEFRIQVKCEVLDAMDRENYYDSRQFRQEVYEYLLKFPAETREKAEEVLKQKEIKQRVEKKCQYHSLQLKAEYVEQYRKAHFDARHKLRRMCSSVDWEPEAYAASSGKINIFSLQTPGLNLVYEYFSGKNLTVNERQLSNRIYFGSGIQQFALGNCFLMGPFSKRHLQWAREWFESCPLFTLSKHVAQHYASVASLCTEEKSHKQYEEEDWKAPARLYVYGHFFMRSPSQNSLSLIASSLLRARYRYLTPLEALQSDCTEELQTMEECQTKSALSLAVVPIWHYRYRLDSNRLNCQVVQDTLLPCCEFEVFWGYLGCPIEYQFDRIPKVLAGEVARQWFRRQHLLWGHFLRISLYIHEPWIRENRLGKMTYSADFSRAVDYLDQAYLDFDEWSLFTSFVDRLKKEDIQLIPKPDRFYPALGWSKYWKQALITLNPSEATEQLDCVPFEGGRGCSD